MIRVPRNFRFEKPTSLKFFQQNMFGSTNFTAGLLQKISGAGLNSMIFMEYRKGCSTKFKFLEVEVNYPSLPLVSGK